MTRVWATVVAILAAAVPAAAQDTVKVTASTLNVRNGPGTGYSVIGQVSSGQIYVQVGSSGSWRKIWFSNTTGWVHGAYITGSSVGMGKVTASTLNVRTGPGTGYAVAGTAPYGSWWALIGTSGSWKKIYYKGAARWVHDAYITGSGSGPTMGGGATPAPSGGLPTSSAGFVQLPASGPGFYAYSSGDRRWGVPNMVYKLMTAASTWKSQHAGWPRIGVGDISKKYGGYFPPHASHQHGKDVDIRPVRTYGEGPVTVGWSTYSHSRTKDWITHHVKKYMNVNLIFFNDSAIYNPLWYVQYWSGHFDHMHVRIN